MVRVRAKGEGGGEGDGEGYPVGVEQEVGTFEVAVNDWGL